VAPVTRLCSRNEGKLRELRAALPEWTIELLDADEYPPEEGATYYENALAKARFGRTVGPADAWMLGEDSGLEVAGLGGKTFPGVFIRSPLVESTGSAEVVATHEGRAVALRQGNILALCFHPELTSDRRLHQELVRMAGVGRS